MENFEIKVSNHTNRGTFTTYPNLEALREAKQHHINAIYNFARCYGTIGKESAEFMVYEKTIPEAKKLADKIIKESFGGNFKINGFEGFTGRDLNLDYLSPFN